MVELVNKGFKFLEQREEHKKLENIIKEEIQNTNQKYYTSSMYSSFFLLYRKGLLDRLRERSTMDILNRTDRVDIELKDNHYFELAQSIANKIEKDYGKKVVLEYVSYPSDPKRVIEMLES